MELALRTVGLLMGWVHTLDNNRLVNCCPDPVPWAYGLSTYFGQQSTRIVVQSPYRGLTYGLWYILLHTLVFG